MLEPASQPPVTTLRRARREIRTVSDLMGETTTGRNEMRSEMRKGVAVTKKAQNQMGIEAQIMIGIEARIGIVAQIGIKAQIGIVARMEMQVEIVFLILILGQSRCHRWWKKVFKIRFS